MKILVVCQHFYPENFRINDICFELKKRGHEVTVLTGLPNYPRGKVLNDYRWFKKRKEIVNDIRVIRTFLIGRGKTKIRMAINYMSFAICASIKAIFMKKDFDIIYVYQLSPVIMSWPAIVVKKIKKIPLVLHVLDQWPVSITTGGISKSSLLYKILKKWSINCYNNANLITCSSKSFKDYFINELKLPEVKEFIYLPSYAESNYKNIPTKENNTFDLVFAGNIGPAQSVETIVEAANLLKENEKIKFHIIGDGLSKEFCENLVKKYKLNNIKFYGYFDVKEIPKFYSLADAFLITMVNNEVVNSTLPAKIQSYMLAGKPILGAINGEVKNVIEEAKCGLCCDSLDYKSFAKLIVKASKSDNKIMSTWSNNAYKYYQNNFEKEKCLDQLENIFKKAVN